MKEPRASVFSTPETASTGLVMVLGGAVAGVGGLVGAALMAARSKPGERSAYGWGDVGSELSDPGPELQRLSAVIAQRWLAVTPRPAVESDFETTTGWPRHRAKFRYELEITELLVRLTMPAGPPSAARQISLHAKVRILDRQDYHHTELLQTTCALTDEQPLSAEQVKDPKVSKAIDERSRLLLQRCARVFEADLCLARTGKESCAGYAAAPPAPMASSGS